jgi:hypothetical protein
MFDHTGIGPHDLAWIRRDQFVYYLNLTHALSDPHDWPRLRRDLLRALTDTFALDHPRPHTSRGATELEPASPPAAALKVLDQVRARHDPATDWPAFFDALWNSRHHLRPDL